MEQKVWMLPLKKCGKIINVADDRQNDTSGRNISIRLRELGFNEGDTVTPVFRSPLGDPTAYRIRGALIALRREDADLITVEPAQDIMVSGEGKWGCGT